eukprot:1156168-Pelagomonas_calceolata.AAC.4
MRLAALPPPRWTSLPATLSTWARCLQAMHDAKWTLHHVILLQVPGPSLQPDDTSAWMLPLLQHAAASTAALGAGCTLFQEGGVTCQATQVYLAFCMTTKEKGEKGSCEKELPLKTNVALDSVCQHLVCYLPEKQLLESSGASGKVVVGANFLADTEPDMAYAIAGAGMEGKSLGGSAPEVAGNNADNLDA